MNPSNNNDAHFDVDAPTNSGEEWKWVSWKKKGLSTKNMRGFYKKGISTKIMEGFFKYIRAKEKNPMATFTTKKNNNKNLGPSKGKQKYRWKQNQTNKRGAPTRTEDREENDERA